MFTIDGLTVGCYGLVYGLGEEGWLGWGGGWKESVDWVSCKGLEGGDELHGLVYELGEEGWLGWGAWEESVD